MIVITISGNTGFDNSDRRFIIKSPDGKMMIFDSQLAPRFRACDLYSEIGKYLESGTPTHEESEEMQINQVLADQFANEKLRPWR